MANPRIKIVSLSFHRNGICGEPFEVFLFDDKENGRMVAVRFPNHPDPAVAVLNVEKLAAGDIAFTSNSWRGDVYDCEIDAALKEKV